MDNGPYRTIKWSTEWNGCIKNCTQKCKWDQEKGWKLKMDLPENKQNWSTQCLSLLHKFSFPGCINITIGWAPSQPFLGGSTHIFQEPRVWSCIQITPRYLGPTAIQKQLGMSAADVAFSTGAQKDAFLYIYLPLNEGGGEPTQPLYYKVSSMQIMPNQYLSGSVNWHITKEMSEVVYS